MTPFNPGPPPPHEPAPKGTSSPVLWFVALLGLGVLIVGGGALVWVISQGVARAKADAAAVHESATTSRSHAKLPPVQRQVPNHALSLLDGCSDAELATVRDGIDGAIEVGAPLYNSGNLAGCYHMYEGTAADLERKLSAACAGPRSALEAGRTRAAASSTAGAQAWAMRDAFDGLLDVIARRDASH